MNKQKLLEQVSGLPSTLLDKRVLVDKSTILGLIEQLDEPQKVVIPKFVAEWIEEARKQKLSLRQAMEYYTRPENIELWFDYSNNQETFARAWLDGYNVREKLYTVEIPNPNDGDVLICLLRDKGTGKIVADAFVFEEKLKNDWKKHGEYQLTKAEIKQDFEWAWKWAEEVK